MRFSGYGLERGGVTAVTHWVVDKANSTSDRLSLRDTHVNPSQAHNHPTDVIRSTTSRLLSHASPSDNSFPLSVPHLDSPPPSGLPIASRSSPSIPIIVTY